MDHPYDTNFTSYEVSSRHNSSHKRDISISDELADWSEKLRISALTNAAEISPLVKETSIGKNSSINKDDYKENTPSVEIAQPEENLLKDKLREELRYSLILKQYENKIQNTFEELCNDFIENLITNRAEAMTKFSQIQSDESERRAQQFKKRKTQMYKSLQENDNMSLLEMARCEEQNYQSVNKAVSRFASMTYNQTKTCYKEITNILMNEPLGKVVCSKYLPAIKQVLGDINVIMELCKTGAVTDSEIKQAELLAMNIENIKQKICDDLEALKAEELLKKQKEEELIKKKLLEEKIAEEKKAKEAAAAAAVAAAAAAATAAAVAAEKAKEEQAKRTKPVFYSDRNYSYYEELKNYLEQYEAQYKDLLQDVSLKKFRFDCQKAVNTPVNALSSVSALHMRDKYDKLFKLLKGERVQVLDIYVTATQHPQGLAYCTALLAKKIVRQGDLLVSSSTEAAYPLAAVTVALWAQYPHFGRLVEAYFHRLCPYLVPMFLPQKEGQTDKDFYLSRGYTYNDEGVVEKQDKFLKRMSGIFRLQCAIWTAKMPRFLNAPHPLGLRYAWQWLASFINLKAEPDISATLLNDFYIMCGSTCNKFYGPQFRKMLVLTSSQYLKILENIDEGGPKTRLEVYLQTTLKSNDVPQPPAPAQQINW